MPFIPYDKCNGDNYGNCPKHPEVNIGKGKTMASEKREDGRNILKEIRDALGMTAKDMIREWKELPEKDKADIRKGVEDGSLTY